MPDDKTDPDQSTDSQQTAANPNARLCQSCGSSNIRPDSALRSRPSVLWVILIGWIFLLIRAAFTKRKAVCIDCGATEDYRSTGSFLALVFLILLVLGVIISAMADAN